MTTTQYTKLSLRPLAKYSDREIRFSGKNAVVRLTAIGWQAFRKNVCGKLDAAQRVLNSREPKYVPIRTANGRTQVWIQRLKQWVPVLDGDGEATTKDIHDAIRKWELEKAE